MKVELHILQNFAPSNLNRDDTGSPKSCEFGGYRRARVSSQCVKRAARTYARKNGLLDKTAFGDRSKLFKEQLTRMLVKENKDRNEAEYVADFVLSQTKLTDKGAEESGYLVFLGVAQINTIKQTCLEKWPAFEQLISNSVAQTKLQNELKAARGEKKKIERAINKQMTPELEQQRHAAEAKIKGLEEQIEKSGEALEKTEQDLRKVAGQFDDILRTRRAADIAMFGRMITSAPKYNITAASQVAHAVSTNTVNDVEFDYFTALDELKQELDPDADAGAGMVGTSEFNSACYYRYANVDLTQLKDNLKDGDSELVKETLKAFIEAFVMAVPSGKQNSYASLTLPSLVLAVVREGAFCSLANAFATPVRPQSDGQYGLIGNSIQRLDLHFGKLEKLYGKYVGTRKAIVCTDADEYLSNLKKAEFKAEAAGSLEQLIQKIIDETIPDKPQKGDEAA